jgi:hypothetical protein
MSNSSAPDSKLSRSSFELVISTVCHRLVEALAWPARFRCQRPHCHKPTTFGAGAVRVRRARASTSSSRPVYDDLVLALAGRRWPLAPPIPGAAVAPRQRAAVLPGAAEHGAVEAARVFPVPSADEPHRVPEVRCDGPGPASSPRPWRRWHPAPVRPRLPDKCQGRSSRRPIWAAGYRFNG